MMKLARLKLRRWRPPPFAGAVANSVGLSVGISVGGSVAVVVSVGAVVGACVAVLAAGVCLGFLLLDGPIVALSAPVGSGPDLNGSPDVPGDVTATSRDAGCEEAGVRPTHP